MDNINNFEIWIKNLSEFSFPMWEQMPDLDLYMDQVITFLDRELKAMKVDDNNIITASMINNYVKANLLPAPEKKKYGKEHLAYLFIISALKQVLSISDINRLIKNKMNTTEEYYNTYHEFSNLVTDSMKKIIEENIVFFNNLDFETDSDIVPLYDVVLKLAITAQINKIIADKILLFIENCKQQKNKEKEEIIKKQKETADKFEKEETAKKQKGTTVKVKTIKE